MPLAWPNRINAMSQEITSQVVQSFKQRLENHPVYASVRTIGDLRIFMQHHVYSVWDFMSLIKYLQSRIAPCVWPWVAQGDGDVRRFINELVLEEESDETVGGAHYASHFELYQSAMAEIGADVSASRAFIQGVADRGIAAALEMPEVPRPSAAFTARTFGFIDSGHPHEVGAALALGREHIIPCMFRAILSRIGVSAQDAPVFHYYLNRHIHLDEDFHAPLSLRLLNGLVGGDPEKYRQAVAAGQQALEARLAFWDGVQVAIEQARGSTGL